MKVYSHRSFLQQRTAGTPRYAEENNKVPATSYFSKDVTFENEKEILHAKATRYKPDRLVFDGTRVVLLDFKAPPLAQEHIDNLNYYASLFKDLLFAEIKCVLYYFDVEEVEQ